MNSKGQMKDIKKGVIKKREKKRGKGLQEEELVRVGGGVRGGGG